jgi:hypothetical protein
MSGFIAVGTSKAAGAFRLQEEEKHLKTRVLTLLVLRAGNLVKKHHALLWALDNTK